MVSLMRVYPLIHRSNAIATTATAHPAANQIPAEYLLVGVSVTPELFSDLST